MAKPEASSDVLLVVHSLRLRRRKLNACHLMKLKSYINDENQSQHASGPSLIPLCCLDNSAKPAGISILFKSTEMYLSVLCADLIRTHTESKTSQPTVYGGGDGRGCTRSIHERNERRIYTYLQHCSYLLRCFCSEPLTSFTTRTS